LSCESDDSINEDDDLVDIDSHKHRDTDDSADRIVQAITRTASDVSAANLLEGDDHGAKEDACCSDPDSTTAVSEGSETDCNSDDLICCTLGSTEDCASPPSIVREESIKNIPASDELPLATNDEKLVSRSVQFDKLHVFEFPTVLGDHPSVADGPPIRLDYGRFGENGSWEALPVYSYSMFVEDYESKKPDRRSGYELRIPAELRTQWIVDEIGCPATAKKSISAARGSVLKIKHQRAVSHALQDQEHLMILQQNLVRKCKRWIDKKKSKSTEIAPGSAEAWVQQYKEQKATEKMASRMQKLQQDPTCKYTSRGQIVPSTSDPF
jgi:hypothetical protein